jgi:ankyrin repeat protein
MKKDDGFSAFHLAALNNHKEVVKCLLQSRADKEILNNRRQTPLLLAVAQLNCAIIELLVEKSQCLIEFFILAFFEKFQFDIETLV